MQKAGVRFVAADMPEANEMVVGIVAAVAQAERTMISVRTKAALAEKAKFYAGLLRGKRPVPGFKDDRTVHQEYGRVLAYEGR